MSRDRDLLKRRVKDLQLTILPSIPDVDLQTAHEADVFRHGEFGTMASGVPPQGFDLGLLFSDQKLEVFLLERLGGAQRQSPHQEERLRIAYAMRFEPGQRSDEISGRVIHRDLGVRVQSLPDVVIAEDFRRMLI